MSVKAITEAYRGMYLDENYKHEIDKANKAIEKILMDYVASLEYLKPFIDKFKYEGFDDFEDFANPSELYLSLKVKTNMFSHGVDRNEISKEINEYRKKGGSIPYYYDKSTYVKLQGTDTHNIFFVDVNFFKNHLWIMFETEPKRNVS